MNIVLWRAHLHVQVDNLVSLPLLAFVFILCCLYMPRSIPLVA